MPYPVHIYIQLLSLANPIIIIPNYPQDSSVAFILDNPNPSPPSGQTCLASKKLTSPPPCVLVSAGCHRLLPTQDPRPLTALSPSCVIWRLRAGEEGVDVWIGGLMPFYLRYFSDSEGNVGDVVMYCGWGDDRAG